jgi:hypothetical protein
MIATIAMVGAMIAMTALIGSTGSAGGGGCSPAANINSVFIYIRIYILYTSPAAEAARRLGVREATGGAPVAGARGEKRPSGAEAPEAAEACLACSTFFASPPPPPPPPPPPHPPPTPHPHPPPLRERPPRLVGPAAWSVCSSCLCELRQRDSRSHRQEFEFKLFLESVTFHLLPAAYTEAILGASDRLPPKDGKARARDCKHFYSFSKHL